MKLTRDSVLLQVGMYGGFGMFVLTFLSTHWSLVPIPVSMETKQWVELATALLGGWSAKQASSSLPVSPEGHVAEVIAHNAAIDQAVSDVKVLASAPPIPPITPGVP